MSEQAPSPREDDNKEVGVLSERTFRSSSFWCWHTHAHTSLSGNHGRRHAGVFSVFTEKFISSYGLYLEKRDERGN